LGDGVSGRPSFGGCASAAELRRLRLSKPLPLPLPELVEGNGDMLRDKGQARRLVLRHLRFGGCASAAELRRLSFGG